MKVDLVDVLFWMDAIRNSENRDRTLESFWKGQINSKVWLIENLKKYLSNDEEYKIAIYGGWNGVLASLLYNSEINVRQITSVDIDPVCEKIAYTVNKQQEMLGIFTAVTADMCEYVVDDAQIVINTSCEHISQEQYDHWLSLQPVDSLIVLQSNNFYDCKEHVRCVSSIDSFLEQSSLIPIWYDEIELPKYTRYMIIGKK